MSGKPIDTNLRFLRLHEADIYGRGPAKAILPTARHTEPTRPGFEQQIPQIEEPVEAAAPEAPEDVGPDGLPVLPKRPFGKVFIY